MLSRDLADGDKEPDKITMCRKGRMRCKQAEGRGREVGDQLACSLRVERRRQAKKGRRTWTAAAALFLTLGARSPCLEAIIERRGSRCLRRIGERRRLRPSEDELAQRSNLHLHFCFRPAKSAVPFRLARSSHNLIALTGEIHYPNPSPACSQAETAHPLRHDGLGI